jgi:uncharacterized protein (TIGR03437 family)
MRLLPTFFLALLLSCSTFGQTYTISTFAGGGLPVNIPGTSASLGSPQFVAVDRTGSVLFAVHDSVLRLDATTGILTLVAGNGTPGFSGDNGPATGAQLYLPQGLAVDSSNNLYIADTGNNRIRKVSNGVITTVAGNGTVGFSGDNGPATNAQLNGAEGLAADSAGNLYIADSHNQCIRKVSNGVITTVAGNGKFGFGGDNGPATNAQLYLPHGLAVDSSNNLYIADTYNNRIRKVSNGVIATMAGTGSPGFGGDNGPAASAQLNSPYGVAVDSAGNLYIADYDNDRIRKVSNGVISTVVGSGTVGFSGDNGPATSAQLNTPLGVALDLAGNLYIADTFNDRIRKVSNGTITTVAGNGQRGAFSGDNGPATSAQLNGPLGVTVDAAGNLYIADSENNRIRKVSQGIITTVAGNGSLANLFSVGDNGPATSAQLNSPYGVAVDAAGNLYIADSGYSRIRKVSYGIITTVAGNGTMGFSGDNGPATSAQLGMPAGVAVDAAGNLYIADSFNNRIRKVSNGVITTVAGMGPSGDSAGGFSGDNGPATSAQLRNPQGVAVDAAGNLYIADSENNRIRKVSNGVITTVAGTSLSYPLGVAVDAAGNLYIADDDHCDILRISNGVIAVVGGNGMPGVTGDNGPATSAELSLPSGVALDATGKVYIADWGNNRIRVLTPFSCTYSVALASLQAPASGGNLNFTIQTTALCSWAVSGLPSWIAVSGASSGAGPATVTLVVASNSGTARSATVSIAGVSVTVTQPVAVPVLTIKGVTNAASYAIGAVSPGEMVTLFGTNIGPAISASATTDPSTGKLATTIGGVQVLFNGIAAPMIYASSTQVSAVVPYEMAPVVSPSVWIKYAGQTSNAYQLTTATTAPGLFTQNASGSGPGAILNQDNSVNGPGHTAAKGSIVQVYLTGEGQTSPQGVTGAITTATLPPPQVTPAPVLAVGVTINGLPALYVYAGEAPGLVAGMMQLNVQIPSTAPSGDLPILVSIGGNTSQNGVTVSVQ